MRHVHVLLLSSGLLLGPGLSAQAPVPGRLADAIGQTVRIWTPDGRRVEGSLEEVGDGTVTLTVTDDIGLPGREVLSVARAQVAAGQKRQVFAGALLGMAGGAAIFGVLGASQGGGECYSSPCGGADSAVLGAIVGLPLGIAFAPKSTVWFDLDVSPARSSMARASGNRLLRVAVGIPVP